MKNAGFACLILALTGCQLGAKVLAEGLGDAGSQGGASATGGMSGQLGGAATNGGATNAGGTTSGAGTSGNGNMSMLPVLWEGGSNVVSTLGYWWSYIDHSAQSGHIGQGATISPLTDLIIPFAPEADPQAPERGMTIHVIGSVPGAPAWADVTAGLYTDLYWRNEYPDSLIAVYPAAGVGFNFQMNAAPFDVTQGKYIGFAFDMKTAGNTSDISVALSTVGTDLPDPAFGDVYPKQCVYPTDPFSSTVSSQTCFAFAQKLFAVANRVPDGLWHTYCVLWSEMSYPAWMGASATPPPWNHATLQNSLSIHWAMYQPATGTPAPFDVRLDNIKLLAAADAQATANNCDQSRIAASQALIAQ